MGLLTANLDSPMHSAWSNTKCSNWKTNKPCPSCEVTRRQLGDHKFDVVKNKRTADGVARDIAYVEEGGTNAECTKRSRDRGVVVPELANPVRELTFDLVRQFGIDILHQDGLVSEKAWLYNSVTGHLCEERQRSWNMPITFYCMCWLVGNDYCALDACTDISLYF